jgi:hypothetical protein
MNEQFICDESVISNKLLNNSAQCAQQQCLDTPVKTLKNAFFGAHPAAPALRLGTGKICYKAGTPHPPGTVSPGPHGR